MKRGDKTLYIETKRAGRGTYTSHSRAAGHLEHVKPHSAPLESLSSSHREMTPEEARRAAEKLFNLPSSPPAPDHPVVEKSKISSPLNSNSPARNAASEERRILPTMAKPQMDAPPETFEEYVITRSRIGDPNLPKKRGPKRGTKRTSYNLKPKAPPSVEDPLSASLFIDPITPAFIEPVIVDPNAPKKRGRPRKMLLPQPPFPEPLPPPPFPKRPPKIQLLDENGVPIKRPRGRPRKPPLITLIHANPIESPPSQEEQVSAIVTLGRPPSTTTSLRIETPPLPELKNQSDAPSTPNLLRDDDLRTDLKLHQNRSNGRKKQKPLSAIPRISYMRRQFKPGEGWKRRLSLYAR